MKTKTVLGIAVCSYLLLGSSSVLAENGQEEQLPGYSLEQIVVTANRYEKKDVDIAASTVVLTKEDLEQTGTTNLVTALSNVLGLTYMGYGPEGSSLGSKNSNLIIRGMDKGTLVMINGAPINLNGRYHLEDMPFDGIEKVEIVKGGGAVLYGSEAIGGVINIITNNKLKNRVSVGVGSRDRQQYDLSLQAGKLSFAASQKHWGGNVVTSDLITNTKKMNNYMRDQRRNSIYMNYQFDKHSNLLWQRTESKKAYDYVFGDGYQDKSYYGATRYDRKYKYFKNFVQYNYNSDSLKGNVYYNSTATTTGNNDYMSSSGSTKGYPQQSFDKDRDYSYGADIMKIWQGRNAKYSLGTSFQHENYNPDRYAGVDYTKNTYSIYAQWEQQLDKKNNLTLSGRQTWAKMPEKTFSNFSGQIQYVHKLNENESLYATAGQSFRMPYLREMYSSAKKLTGNTELRPEKGIHYEVGWKRNVNYHSWKVALFGYDI